MAAIHRFHPSRLRKSALQPVSEKTRNLCALNAKLAARAVVRDAAKAVRKQRAEGLAELGFTPWRTIARIAKTGGHVLVIVDGDLDRSRWSDLEVLLYRLRGNDGSNMRPIVVVSRSPPAVQDLILWRSIEVYVTEGCVSDWQIPQVLGFDNTASIVLLADACASDNPLLMDRRVLLATSVLEREDELTPDHMLPKVVLEFHHPKSVWHVQEARGFGKPRERLAETHLPQGRVAARGRRREPPRQGGRGQGVVGNEPEGGATRTSRRSTSAGTASTRTEGDTAWGRRKIRAERLRVATCVPSGRTSSATGGRR